MGMNTSDEPTSPIDAAIASDGQPHELAPKNLVLFVIEHGLPWAMEWSCSYYITAYVQDAGEAEALGEAIDVHDVASGVWVAEVDLVDDGPSDWPGARECRLSALACRRATEAEWLEHLRGEWVLPVRESESGPGIVDLAPDLVEEEFADSDGLDDYDGDSDRDDLDGYDAHHYARDPAEVPTDPKLCTRPAPAQTVAARGFLETMRQRDADREAQRIAKLQGKVPT
jgi:hypothetical protein